MPTAWIMWDAVDLHVDSNNKYDTCKREEADKIIQEGRLNEFLQESGSYNQDAAYLYDKANLLLSWRNMIIMAVLFAVIAVLLLKRVDRDKR